MNPVIQPTFSALWTTDARGICVVSQESPVGLIPALKGITLCEWLSIAQADDDAQLALQLTAALECVIPFHIEVPIQCLDGTTRRVLVSGLPDCQPAASRLQYNGFILDITGQRKALEDALRTAAEYRLLIENSTDLIAHCDAEGRYVSISPSYSEMIGWSAEEMIGQRVVDFLHPDDREPAAEALLNIFTGGVLPDVVEVRKLHRDGYYITLGTKACGVSDPYTGHNIGAVLVSRDITRDKEKNADA
ncbi:PAS domain S-box protein [Pantoea tagorei]